MINISLLHALSNNKLYLLNLEFYSSNKSILREREIELVFRRCFFALDQIVISDGVDDREFEGLDCVSHSDAVSRSLSKANEGKLVKSV